MEYEPSEMEYEPTEYDFEQSDRADDFLKEYEKQSFPGQSLDHYSNKIPPIIFKYRNLETSDAKEHTLDIITNQRLYMSKAENLNDPFEGGNVDYLPVESRDDYKKIIEDYRILALSANCFSAPLWAHYSAECKGVCFGFCTFDSFEKIKKVEYSDSINKWAYFSDRPEDAATLEYLCKSSEWSYEKEYRIVKKGNGESHNYFEYKGSELKTIIFGEKIDSTKKEEIMKIAPPNCLLFDLRSDKNAQKYFLIKCDENDKKIETLEALYDLTLR